MSRDSTGTYTRPPGTKAIPGAVITAEQFETAMDDLAAEMTASATVGQLEGFSGRYTTTGTGAAYALGLPTAPSDFAKLLRITFRAHASSVSGTAVITGTLTNQSAVVTNVSSLAGLAVGQTIVSALAAVSFTGNVTNGSNQILAASSTAGLSPGMTITSGVAGFAAGTTIQGIAGTTITLSANYTGTTANSIAIQATPGVQPNTTIAALASSTTNGVTTNTITLSAPAAGSTVVGAALTVSGTSPTLAVNTVPARTILAPDGSALRPGEIIAGQFCAVIPDATLGAYVLEQLPVRMKLNATDTKAAYLSEKILANDGTPLATQTVNGIPALVLPNNGIQIGDGLNTGRDPGPGYLLRDGSVYLQSSYPALFAAIGHRFQDINTVAAGSTSMGTNYGIAYGAGIYVAVGDSSVQSSPNLSTWTARVTPNAVMNTVIFANGLFVAAGEVGRIYTSPDGINWTSRSAAATAVFRGAAYGAGKFVLTTNSGRVQTSPDGITWTEQTAPGIPTAITFGNGLFVAVGSGVYTSPDGVTWTARTGDGSGAFFMSVAYANGVFVAVGTGGRIMTSPDGVNWTSRKGPGTTTLYAVAFGFGVFCAVGEVGVVATSYNGIVWTAKAVAGTPTINAITAGPTIFAMTQQGAATYSGTPVANAATQFRIPNDSPSFGYIKAT